MRWIIEYEDGSGERTTREITDAVAIDPQAFTARCSLREAERTFLFARVKSAADANSGEVLPDLRSLLGRV